MRARLGYSLGVIALLGLAMPEDGMGYQESARNRPVAFGATALVGDWTLRVSEVDFDATEEVLAENQFNEAPEPGHVFVTALVEGTYDGEETGNMLWDFSLKVVGEKSVAYGQSDPGCGVVPNDLLSVEEVFPGGTVKGNACWSVPVEDISSIVMFAEPTFSFDNERQFFALAPVGVPHDGEVTAPVLGARAGRPKEVVRDANQPVGSRGNPVPLGQAIRVGDWTVQVAGVTPDATQLVLQENQFNDPPQPGEQFFLVDLSVRFDGTGEETGNASWDLIFKVVGAKAVAYGGSESGCGVVPNAMWDQPEVFAGGVVVGQECWSVPADEVGSLVLTAEPLSFTDDETVFFDLR